MRPRQQVFHRDKLKNSNSGVLVTIIVQEPWMRTIEVRISKAGEVKITTQGYSGSACQEATKRLEDVLGQKGKEYLTSEYYDQATTHLEVSQ